jgi:hypothetical protein
MLTYEKLKTKLNKDNKKLIITVVKLPSGALETLVNNSELDAKANYLLNAYGKNLRLKTMDQIELLDIIVL